MGHPQKLVQRTLVHVEALQLAVHIGNEGALIIGPSGCQDDADLAIREHLHSTSGARVAALARPLDRECRAFSSPKRCFAMAAFAATIGAEKPRLQTPGRGVPRDRSTLNFASAGVASPSGTNVPCAQSSRAGPRRRVRPAARPPLDGAARSHSAASQFDLRKPPRHEQSHRSRPMRPP